MHELETARVRLRPFIPNDLDELSRIYGTPIVMRYLGREGKPMTRAETETTLLSMIAHWQRHGFGRWAVVNKESEVLIGCAGLRSFEGIAELVYLIDQPFWGMGLATEVAEACLRYGFDVQQFHHIIGFSRLENAVSRHVMEKLGMRYEGETNIFDIDVVRYTIAREDYR